MSDFSGLNPAITGLHAHRKRMDVIAENLANVDTPGYHRQVTRLTAVDTRRPGLFSGRGGTHGGVTADVSRRWDQLLDTSAKQARSRSATLEAQAAALAEVEQSLGSLAEGGLADRLQRLWNSFDDLANNPDDLAARNTVLGNATAVVSGFAAHADVIADQRAAQIDTLGTSVDRVNQLASEIAELDRTIAAGSAVDNPPNAALDERDRLASELAGLVGGQVAYDEQNRIRFTVDGHNLVMDGQAGTVSLTTVPDPALDDVGYPKLVLVAAAGREIRLIGGTVHGGLQVVNDLLTTELRGIDELAALTVSSVNAIHQTGTGLDGSSGLSLFDPAGTTARTVAVSADVAGQPARLAASDGSGVLDNTVALALAGLGQDPAGPSAAHAEYVADLGVRVSGLRGRADAAGLASTHAESARQSAAGVNLDEELTDLMSAQRAFEASSRVISAIDQMLDVLINRTGIVGR